MTNVYDGFVLADLHNAAFDASIWYEELDKGVLTDMENADNIDFVIIAGDYFHKKISANSDDATKAFQFLTRLMQICHRFDAKLRIIKGTESHDNQQLDMLESIQKIAPCDFAIRQVASDEYLFEDFRVLYLPEEYIAPADFDAYYAPYFSTDKAYDLVVGHGLVDKAVFVASIQESERTMKHAPIFEVSELMRICKGLIYFGHIHKPMQIGTFRYVGSYSRWAFGEEEEKGYYTGQYNPTDAIYVDQFRTNPYARKYESVKVEYPSVLSTDNEMTQLKFLQELVDNQLIDYVRLEVSIPAEHPKPLLVSSLIKELFARRREVKVRIIANEQERKRKEVEERVATLLDQYDFIFDKTTPVNEKLSQFINIRHSVTIPAPRIEQYLTQDIQKIIPAK